VIVLGRARSHPVVRAALDAGAADVVLEDGGPVELFTALRLGPARPEEEPMLRPNVIEIQRGSAHLATAGPSKPAPGTGADRRVVRLPNPAYVLQ
jgi:hypothetical protein